MMRGLNRVTLIGNLGNDPEIQYIGNQIGVVKISLATTEVYKDKTGNNISETEWHTIVLWRGLAEFASKYLKKGSSVYIEGKLKYRKYEDKNGNTRNVTEVLAEQILMLDKKISANLDDGQ